MDFWISLCCQFDISDQLTSLINILNFLLQLPNDKEDGKTKRKFYIINNIIMFVWRTVSAKSKEKSDNNCIFKM